jgi:hypothetical protein
VYVVLDDNSTDYSFLHSKYKNITFVQIDNSILYNTGFINSSRVGDKITTGYGWDKAVYFSSTIKKNEYDYIWISEEDVFFYDETTLLKIDNKYDDEKFRSSREDFRRVDESVEDSVETSSINNDDHAIVTSNDNVINTDIETNNNDDSKEIIRI